MRFLIIILVVIAGIGFIFYRNANQFPIPMNEKSEKISSLNNKILITDGVKHSIPLNEILSGGPGKDGIPSIDNPKFISTKEADEYLTNTDVGLGLVFNGVERFYPYQVLVWHEIVNDTIKNDRVLVTYCPLCATGIVFDPKVNGIAQEFGVSGKLWQSNLLMYNRTQNPDDESLWSQVLGEAVLGVSTGEKLKILPADTVKYGAWKKAHPNTEVLSRETGAIRSYGLDPYGDYYTDESVSFGATFSDNRLHPKTFVLGIEIDGKFKAYERDSLKVGTTKDTFAGKNIEITKDETDVVKITANGGPVPHVDGFWFSWLAVHPETELLK
ncbi:MAG: DUF3179 domain-containing protein [Candidatus Paceibacteria bacterium]